MGLVRLKTNPSGPVRRRPGLQRSAPRGHGQAAPRPFPSRLIGRTGRTRRMTVTAVRPRLLVIVTLAETGGAQTFVRSLVEGLRSEYTIDVAAHGPTGALSEACLRLNVP